MIKTICWVLPRPRKNKFRWGFPLHFEQKLWRELGCPKKVLHPFGGMAEIGIRVDIDKSVKPDYMGDAHKMSWIKDNSYDLVVLDPPYVLENQTVRYKDYIKEAVRVCKPKGFIAVYHWVMTPRPEGTRYYMRIIILTRVWHRPRVCCIFQKE